VQADRQVAEALQRQRVVGGLVDAGVDPRPGAHEVQGIFKAARAMPVSMAAWRICASGPTVVGRSKALWNGTTSSARRHVVEHHRAAAGGALAEAAPVVDHFRPWLSAGRTPVAARLFIHHQVGMRWA
jgi:hypothetical protein